MQNQKEWRANYARALSNAFIKQSNIDELEYYINMLKQQGKRVCDNRPAPGLHESYYRIYCQYELGGK